MRPEDRTSRRRSVKRYILMVVVAGYQPAGRLGALFRKPKQQQKEGLRQRAKARGRIEGREWKPRCGVVSPQLDNRTANTYYCTVGMYPVTVLYSTTTLSTSVCTTAHCATAALLRAQAGRGGSTEWNARAEVTLRDNSGSPRSSRSSQRSLFVGEEGYEGHHCSQHGLEYSQVPYHCG